MKKIFALAFILVSVSAYFFMASDEIVEDDFTEETKVVDHQHSHGEEDHKKDSAKIIQNKIIKKPNMDKAVVPPFVPKNTDEESLGKTSALLKGAMDSRNDSNQLKDELRKLDLIPVISYDKNPYTGNMRVLRTKKNLSGTRYIHAQYFENEDGVETLQHLSFEYRPGPGALAKAVSAIKSEFKLEKDPNIVKKDFAGWTLGNGYVVWCSKRNLESLKEDPFNAYTDNDDGTIRCATELDPHEGDMEDHPGE